MKKSFFSGEPLFFKFIYIGAFLAVLYVVYENIFLEEEQHLGINLYLLVLFGMLHLRKAGLMTKMNKSELSRKDKGSKGK